MRLFIRSFADSGLLAPLKTAKGVYQSNEQNPIEYYV